MIGLPFKLIPSACWMSWPTLRTPAWKAAPDGWMAIILNRIDSLTRTLDLEVFIYLGSDCLVLEPPSIATPRDGRAFLILTG